MEVAFSLYKGFLIAQYSETDVRAYRSRGYYASNTASYQEPDPAFVNQVIDVAGDQGDFSELDYNTLMQILGRARPTQAETQLAEPALIRYPNNIMEIVRQHLGLEDSDTSRDVEINGMSPNSVFAHVLEWEGIIGYQYTIPGWIKDIYGVELT